MSNITNVTIRGLHCDSTVTFDCAELTIDQRFKPEWSTENAYGRMDPIATFSRTNRDAAFKFVTLATKESEALQLQGHVELFMKMQYPKYTNLNGIPTLMSPPFFHVSVLQNKLYKEIEGYITDLTITPGSSGKTVPLVDSKGNFYERKYDISFSMQILHEHVVGWHGGRAAGGTFVNEGKGFVFYSDLAINPDKDLAAAPNPVKALADLGEKLGKTTKVSQQAQTNGVDGNTSLQQGNETFTENNKQTAPEATGIPAGDDVRK